MIALKMKPHWISPEEYLVKEELATEKSEYFNGEVYAMAGGSHNHDMICGGIYAQLRQFARKNHCTAYTSGMKLQVKSNGLFTYPDAMLVYGKVQFAAGRKDIVTNPLLLVEVLSDSTKSYDRGEKFGLYRGLDTFSYYLLINQEHPLIEIFQKTDKGWLLNEVQGIDAILNIESLGLEIPLAEIYADVDWEPEAQ